MIHPSKKQMEKMKQCFLLCVVLLLTGCSPRVVSDMFVTNYPAAAPDSVRVFQVGQKVPPKSLAIGKVKVVDNGFSGKGDYSMVLKMAVEETARHGGNGLIIERHRVPDMISTIHRVWGTMLRMDETVSDSLALTSVGQTIESDQAYQYYQEEARVMQEERSERMKNLPRQVLKVNYGLSWLTSKYETGRRSYDSKLGTGFDVGLDFYWKSGIGIGLMYAHTRTEFDEGIKMYTNFVGPGVLFSEMIGKKFRMDAGIMLGYCRYSETWKDFRRSEDRFAALMRLGMEYMLSPNIGVGVQANMFTVSLKKPEGIELKSNEFYGVRRIGLEAGLRLYL